MKYKETQIGKVPTHWNVLPIKEIAEVVTDYVANGSFASLAKNVVYKDEEDFAVLIRLVDYNNDFQGKFVFIDEHAYEFLSKSKLYGNEIIISNVGANVGTVFRCPKLRYKMSLAPNSVMVKFKGNDDFYFHWLRGYNGQQMLKSIVTGSAQPKFNKTNFKEMVVPVPPIGEQNKIASILNSIEEKIKLNKQINENLEQQAQALFKSWFLNYEPWKGIAPNSWLHGKLGDFADIKRGGSPRPIQEYLSDSGLRWLKISDVTSLQTPFVIVIKDHIIENGLKKTVFLKAGSLVLSNSATPGIPKILDVDSCIHDGWLYFPESKFSNEYLYLYFKYIRQQLVNLSNGSVFNNLKTDILKGYPTILPDEETLQRFDEIIKPMFLQMQNLTRESHNLMDLRDSILPRLMSGELDVSDIQL